MGTSSNRSAGTQVTQKGVVQGEVLVDPVSGLPVGVITDNAGVKRLAVDANLTADGIVVDTRDLDASTDNVALKDTNTGAKLRINNDGSIDANTLINASSDNIAIADSTTGYKLKVNPDGSINTTDASTGAIAGTPAVFNVAVPSANTEVSQALPANTRQFTISVRGGSAKIQLAFTSGQSGTQYLTIGRGAMYSQDNVLLASVTLYFQLDKAGQTVEILAWS